MNLVISPEPSAEEHAAITAAVRVVLATDGGNRDPAPWWEAGLREGIERDGEAPD